jgi:hypothetical protein
MAKPRHENAMAETSVEPGTTIASAEALAAAIDNRRKK